MSRRDAGSRWIGLGAWLGAATVVMVAGCGSNGPSPDRANSSTTALQSSCRASQLRLGLGPRISEQTGQSTVVFTILNVGRGHCSFLGYPAVRLEDSRGHVLAFRFRDGGDLEITGKPAHRVTVGSRATAYVAINKYRCDLREQGTARRAVMVLPGLSKPLSVTLAQYPVVGFCGPRQPGSTVDVSPVEPSVIATQSLA